MLTKRQKQIYEFINHYSGKNGISPTLEEIAKKFRLSSVATVHEHLFALQRKGYVSKERGHARTIKTISSKITPGLAKISLLGIIPAGGPIEAIVNPETIEVPQSMLSGHNNHFALLVSGTSMIEEGIFDGDIVIVHQQQTINDGEKAVAYLPDRDSVTLKKIYRGNNYIKLVPANHMMAPFYETNVEIQGKVVGVLRRE